MSVIELKKQLHQTIDEIENEKLLLFLKSVMENTADYPNDNIVEVSDAERKAIEQGLRDMEEGRVISYEEVKKKYAKWFMK